jgi:hypothetical protein
MKALKSRSPKYDRVALVILTGVLLAIAATGSFAADARKDGSFAQPVAVIERPSRAQRIDIARQRHEEMRRALRRSAAQVERLR